MNTDFISIESEKAVEVALAQVRLSFEQVVACGRALRTSNNFDLRDQVARRAIEVALAQNRPFERTRIDLELAARIATSSLVARAGSLAELPGVISEAQILLENAKGVSSPLVRDSFAATDKKIADLMLCLADASTHSLVAAAALLRDRDGPFERPDLAIEATDIVLMDEPRNMVALTLKGSSLSDLSQFDEAVEVLEDARRIEPRNRFLLPAYSRALEGCGKIEQALANVELSLTMWPDDEAAIRRLLTIYKATRRSDEFGKALERLKDLTPQVQKRNQWIDLLAIGVLIDVGDLEAAITKLNMIGTPEGGANKKLWATLQQKLVSNRPNTLLSPYGSHLGAGLSDS